MPPSPIRALAAIGVLLSGALAPLVPGNAAAQEGENAGMSFFITSVGSGNGADLGGLAGADQHCHMLAEAVGAGDRGWRAYLSTIATASEPAVNARDRIGAGPWYNAKGVA